MEDNKQDPILKQRHIFNLRNHVTAENETDNITAIGCADTEMVVATNQGFIYKVEIRNEIAVKNSINLHKKKINQVYLEQGTAVFTVSDDGFFRMTSMLKEFDNLFIRVGDNYQPV